MVIIIFYLQWHTGVDEETFKYVSIKIAQTTRATEEMPNFGDYPQY